MFKMLPLPLSCTTAAIVIACCLRIGAAPVAEPSPPPTEAEKAQAAKQQKVDQDRRSKERHLALLDESRRLSAAGSYEKANTIIAGVLNETNDPDVIAKAKAILVHNGPSLRDNFGLSNQTLFTIAAWWVDVIVCAVALILLYRLLRIARFLWSKTRRGKWRVDSIADSTNLGLADIIVESLTKWSSKTPPVTSGLLKLERLQLSSARLELPPTQVDLSVALKNITLQVGGVSLSGIASAGEAIRGWLNARCPWIKGKAIQSGPELFVLLTSLGPDGRANTVTASVAVAPSPSPLVGTPPFSLTDIKTVAEAASYKTFYLISKKGSTVVEAESANKLREGLNLLGLYIFGENPGQLGAAYEAFRSARTARADLYEAYLYEGITLDLLLQHDEAIKRFQYLETEPRIEDQSLRQKATYNKAISLFRKYKYADTKKAANALDGLIEDTQDSPESQIRSMALAAKASVIAHYPMYWQEDSYGDRSGDTQVVLERKKASSSKVTGWIAEVKEDTKQLSALLAKVKTHHLWDEGEEQQLEWAIKNALGNVHLNCATYFFGEPYADDKWETLHEEYLQIAYDSFQECAMLITPGIEILTNLAKVSLELNRVQQGCNYLEQAINLNPLYEYAYYSLAKVWDKKNETAKVVKVLQSFPQNGTPIIAEFVELFDKYDAELHPKIGTQKDPVT